MKNIILSFVLLLNTYNAFAVYSLESEKDIFEVFKVYSSNISNDKASVEIIDEGVSLEDVIEAKVESNKAILDKVETHSPDDESDNSSDNSNDESSDESSDESNSINVDSNLNISNKPYKPPTNEANKFFAGTTDYTDLDVSKKDAFVNSWSAIREEYSKFDDGGKDNVTIIATAYTSAAEENGGYAGMNAIGGRLGPGCIAAPKDIPFQTKIRISGLGVFNVEDRGGAIVRVNENTIRLDVWMDSYREAMKFGKRVYKGRIL